MKIRYSYLPQQFENCDDLWDDLKQFVKTGDFTLGKPLQRFEQSFASLMGKKYAIGVNSGTDAIKIALRSCGVRPGDTVITSANTFVATVGAILELGATPIFVDVGSNYCMDSSKIEASIQENTTAIVPVHFAGYISDMKAITQLAEKYDLNVVEDSCQCILGELNQKYAGTFGKAGAFSLHPLKNINVWADGGIIVTDSKEINDMARLLRNHGLVDRNTVAEYGYNSRLDTFQAVVGSWLLPQALNIRTQRIKNAEKYNAAFRRIKAIELPVPLQDSVPVYHLYMIRVSNRDSLLQYLIERGIPAKIHYPIPIYRQPATHRLGGQYKEYAFEVTDDFAERMISLPCDQHLTEDEVNYVIRAVEDFYA